LSAAIGRHVQAVEEKGDAWEARALAADLGDYQRATLKAMFDYYAKFGLGGSPQVLTCLLGRPPGSLAAFAARTLDPARVQFS
jgi:hypothetical protein